MTRVRITFNYISQAPGVNFPQTVHVIVTGREEDLQAMAAQAQAIGGRVVVGEFLELGIRSIEALPAAGGSTHG